jgi:hypothetical protein
MRSCPQQRRPRAPDGRVAGDHGGLEIIRHVDAAEERRQIEVLARALG